MVGSDTQYRVSLGPGAVRAYQSFLAPGRAFSPDRLSKTTAVSRDSRRETARKTSRRGQWGCKSLSGLFVAAARMACYYKTVRGNR